VVEGLGIIGSDTLIGVIWALWHTPLIIFLGYSYLPHRDVVGILMYIAICIVWSIIFVYLKLLSIRVIV